MLFKMLISKQTKIPVILKKITLKVFLLHQTKIWTSEKTMVNIGAFLSHDAKRSVYKLLNSANQFEATNSNVIF